jgi:hypothetical protein
MANSGYIINSGVTLNFNSGPLSGTLVSSSYVVEFDEGSSFTSSILCGEEYEYKILDLASCAPSGICTPPSINRIFVTDCDNYNYTYTIQWNINGNIADIPETVIQYSNQSSFISSSTVSANSQTITNTASIMSTNIDISDMNNLPLNSSTPMYFRLYNSCTSNGTSSFDDYEALGCRLLVGNPTGSYNLIILAENTPNGIPCAESNAGFTNSEGFVGLPFYIDTNSFDTATNIYKNNSNPPTYADPNWYTNGIIARYWNGLSFNQSIICN